MGFRLFVLLFYVLVWCLNLDGCLKTRIYFLISLFVMSRCHDMNRQLSSALFTGVFQPFFKKINATYCQRAKLHFHSVRFYALVWTGPKIGQNICAKHLCWCESALTCNMIYSSANNIASPANTTCRQKKRGKLWLFYQFCMSESFQFIRSGWISILIIIIMYILILHCCHIWLLENT